MIPPNRPQVKIIVKLKVLITRDNDHPLTSFDPVNLNQRTDEYASLITSTPIDLKPNGFHITRFTGC